MVVVAVWFWGRQSCYTLLLLASYCTLAKAAATSYLNPFILLTSRNDQEWIKRALVGIAAFTGGASNKYVF